MNETSRTSSPERAFKPLTWVSSCTIISVSNLFELRSKIYSFGIDLNPQRVTRRLNERSSSLKEGNLISSNISSKSHNLQFERLSSLISLKFLLPNFCSSNSSVILPWNTSFDYYCSLGSIDYPSNTFSFLRWKIV